MSSIKSILLVLDLDETLVHATRNKLNIEHDYAYADYYIYRRPYLDWFLEYASADFRLAIWSSADDDYVQAIVERFKPEEIDFEFVWGRSRCTRRRDYDLDVYVQEKRLKKLKKQGYELSKVLIVDDSPEKTRDNYGNAIYVNSFEGDSNDTELKDLANFLSQIKAVENVRSIEKRSWRSDAKAEDGT